MCMGCTVTNAWKMWCPATSMLLGTRHIPLGDGAFANRDQAENCHTCCLQGPNQSRELKEGNQIPPYPLGVHQAHHSALRRHRQRMKLAGSLVATSTRSTKSIETGQNRQGTHRQGGKRAPPGSEPQSVSASISPLAGTKGSCSGGMRGEGQARVMLSTLYSPSFRQFAASGLPEPEVVSVSFCLAAFDGFVEGG